VPTNSSNMISRWCELLREIRASGRTSLRSIWRPCRQTQRHKKSNTVSTICLVTKIYLRRPMIPSLFPTWNNFFSDCSSTNHVSSLQYADVQPSFLQVGRLHVKTERSIYKIGLLHTTILHLFAEIRPVVVFSCDETFYPFKYLPYKRDCLQNVTRVP